MSRTQTGELTERVEVQKAIESRGPSGAPSTATWGTFATRRAKVEPLGGTESLQGQELTSRVTHTVTMRYLPGVTPDMRILWGTRVLMIRVDLSAGKSGRWTPLACEEVFGV